MQSNPDGYKEFGKAVTRLSPQQLQNVIDGVRRCVKCNELVYAYYDSPEPLCKEHWAQWWATNADGTIDPVRLQEARDLSH